MISSCTEVCGWESNYINILQMPMIPKIAEEGDKDNDSKSFGSRNQLLKTCTSLKIFNNNALKLGIEQPIVSEKLNVKQNFRKTKMRRSLVNFYDINEKICEPKKNKYTIISKLIKSPYTDVLNQNKPRSDYKAKIKINQITIKPFPELKVPKFHLKLNEQWRQNLLKRFKFFKCNPSSPQLKLKTPSIHRSQSCITIQTLPK